MLTPDENHCLGVTKIISKHKFSPKITHVRKIPAVSIILVLAAILLLFLTWLLVSPIRLQIDTRRQVYLLQWQGIGRIQLMPVTDNLVIQLRVFFWRKKFYPLEYQPRKKQPKEVGKKKKKSRKVDFQKYKRKGIRLFRSFRIRAFRLDLDTGDYVYNSYLYPAFHFLSAGKRQLTINYRGLSEMFLIVENRLYRMLIAFLF